LLAPSCVQLRDARRDRAVLPPERHVGRHPNRPVM
jgi:hypothetical protein